MGAELSLCLPERWPDFLMQQSNRAPARLAARTSARAYRDMQQEERRMLEHEQAVRAHLKSGSRAQAREHGLLLQAARRRYHGHAEAVREAEAVAARLAARRHAGNLDALLDSVVAQDMERDEEEDRDTLAALKASQARAETARLARAEAVSDARPEEAARAARARATGLTQDLQAFEREFGPAAAAVAASAATASDEEEDDDEMLRRRLASLGVHL